MKLQSHYTNEIMLKYFKCLLFQIHLGRKKYVRPIQSPRRDMMVGVYWDGPNEEYATDWPQIGKVVDITNEDVSIHWYDGVIDGPYKPLRKSREGTDGRKKVAWIDKIPKSCVLTGPFNLTQKKLLPKRIINLLDAKFDDFFE